ncbi:MAG: hypothetical protein LH485_08820 [Sphingomonas bacterium]|nr:hypothetical protein [Sphingomonas bacterium]
MLPEEAALYNEAVASSLTSGNKGNSDGLNYLDPLLAKLGEPTKFRGFIQLLRAQALNEADRTAEAITAVEESIRLLPGYSAPLLAAADVYGYSDRPEMAADYLMRASRLDPDVVRNFDDYDLRNLMQRLSAKRDDRRLKLVSEELLRIGWTGTRIASRSSLVEQAIKRRLADGDVAGAQSLVPELLVPNQSVTLLSNKAYSAVWPAIERWGGAKLQKQWKIYLSEARSRWLVSKDSHTLGDYVTALESASLGDEIIAQALPLFSERLDPQRDMEMVFAVATIAEALAQQGRWKDAHELYVRADKIWPLGSEGSALNIAINHGRLYLFEGKPADALRAIDAAIADARKRGPTINSGALARMHGYRACILHELGRDVDIGTSFPAAIAGMSATSRVWLLLCLKRSAAARQVLLDALNNEAERDEAISFFQKPDDPPLPTPYARRMRLLEDELRKDPTLLVRVKEYGRILPFTLSEGVPVVTEVKSPPGVTAMNGPQPPSRVIL